MGSIGRGVKVPLPSIEAPSLQRSCTGSLPSRWKPRKAQLKSCFSSDCRKLFGIGKAASWPPSTSSAAGHWLWCIVSRAMR